MQRNTELSGAEVRSLPCPLDMQSAPYALLILEWSSPSSTDERMYTKAYWGSQFTDWHDQTSSFTGPINRRNIIPSERKDRDV